MSRAIGIGTRLCDGKDALARVRAREGLAESIRYHHRARAIADGPAREDDALGLGQLVERGPSRTLAEVRRDDGGAGEAQRREASPPGQEKGVKFPTSTAPISVDFHSFRLIFGRVIISRNGLERERLSLERARAERPR